jgi:hypothetical protein
MRFIYLLQVIKENEKTQNKALNRIVPLSGHSRLSLRWL